MIYYDDEFIWRWNVNEKKYDGYDEQYEEENDINENKWLKILWRKEKLMINMKT